MPRDMAVPARGVAAGGTREQSQAPHLGLIVLEHTAVLTQPQRKPYLREFLRQR